MRILAQVVSTTALSVIVSLPHQLIGHIPIHKVTAELNTAMEKLMDRDDKSIDEDASGDEDENENDIPNLDEIFQSGQYVRAIVTAVHPHGITVAPATSVDSEAGAIALGKPKNELEKASRRVELSVQPVQVNKGITSRDLVVGFVSFFP
jgi:rRNA biogenesis protein RRP5